jgi:hypothetical protein
MATHLQWRKKRQLEVYLDGGGAKDGTQRFRDLHDIILRDARDCDYHISDPGNLLHRTWLAMRHRRPDITLEQVDEIITSDKNRELIATAMNVTTYGPIEEAAPDADPSPTGTPEDGPA